MAFSLKKWVTGMLESTRLNDTNTNWTDIESAIDTLQTDASLPKGTLPNNTDLNNVTANGIYFIAGGYTYLNLPLGVTAGVLIVSTPNGTQIVQRFANDTKFTERYRTSSAWTSWSANDLLSGIALTNDLDNFAESPNHAEVKWFMTSSAYTFGAGKNYFAVGFAATRWAMKFMVAFASNNKIYMRHKSNDSSPWTDWEER